MHENDIATLVWVKEPLTAPDLPRRQLIATSLSLLNPSKRDWEMYVSALEELLSSTEISENDLILIRQKYETQRISFSPGLLTPNEIVMRTASASIEAARKGVAAELTAPVQELLTTERRVNQDLSFEIDSIRALADASKERETRLLVAALTRLWRRGRVIQWVTNLAIAGVALVLVAAAFFPNLIPAQNEIVITVAQIGAALITVSGGIAAWFNRPGKRIRRWYLSRGMTRNGISELEAADLNFRI